MGNGHHRLAFHQAVQALLNGGLHFRVQRAGGLVQQEDGRVLQHDACDGDALPLTAAQLYATLTYMGVIPRTAFGVFQTHDEVVRFGAFCRRDNLFFRSLGPPIGDVLAYRAVQE